MLEKLSGNELKKLADKEFRKYLLSKAERNGRGYIYCPLKKKWYPENKIQVAHFKDRHHLEERYDEDNCHLISEQSNMWDSKIPYEGYKSLHHYEYEMYLRKKIGDKKVDKLLDNTFNLSIFGKDKYISIIESLRQKME